MINKTSGVLTATVKQFCGGLDLKLTNRIGNDLPVYPVLTHIVSTYDTKATRETNVRVNAETDDLIIVAISVGTFNIPSGYTVLQQCSDGALIYKYAEYTGSHTITLSGANLMAISVFRNAAIVKTASILSGYSSSFCKADSLSVSKGNMGLVILQCETHSAGPTNSGTAGGYTQLLTGVRNGQGIWYKDFSAGAGTVGGTSYPYINTNGARLYNCGYALELETFY